MRAAWRREGRRWTLSFALESEDESTGPGQGSAAVRLLHHFANITLPVAPGEPHPDLEALAAVFILRPWIGKRLHIGRPVSQTLSEGVARLLKVELGPIASDLETRAPGPILGLSYSSGYDSIAAATVLPSDAPYFHHERVSHPLIPTRARHWRADAFRKLVNEAGSRGRRVYDTQADFEHLCHPYPTLPHWFGFGVGPLLLADQVGLGGLAMGGTLETFYMDMGRSWTGERPGAKGIDPLLDLVGMPVVRPVLGVTEVGTMLLAHRSDLNDLARACVNGSLSRPCGACAKCVRKDLLAGALFAHEEVVSSLLRRPESAPGRRAVSGDLPLYMQAQLEFALARLRTTGWLNELYKRLGSPNAVDTSWMFKVYPPGIDRGVPEQWRADVSRRLAESLDFMTDHDERAAIAWRPGPVRRSQPEILAP